MLSLLVTALSILLILFTLTCSVIGGFTSAYFFKQLGGEKWAWNLILVATLISVPGNQATYVRIFRELRMCLVLLVFSVANTLAIIYHATVAVPAGAIVIIIAILLFGKFQ